VKRAGTALSLAVALVYALVGVGSPLTAQPVPTPTPASGPRIAVEPEEFDFGKVLSNRKVSKEFRIRNFGAADLVIEKVSATCNCTATQVESKVVKPGQSTALNVTFDTRSTLGPVQGSVAIRSNDSTQGTVELKIRATVTGPKP
jgi:hypothetical protein